MGLLGIYDLHGFFTRVCYNVLMLLPSALLLSLFIQQLSLMDDKGDTREDLKLPSGHDDADKLASQIQAMYDEGKELVLTLLIAMDEEQVHAVKELPKEG